MKRFALLATLLGLGLVAGCDKPKAPATPAVTPPADTAPATTDEPKSDETKPAKPADDMPEEEPEK